MLDVLVVIMGLNIIFHLFIFEINIFLLDTHENAKKEEKYKKHFHPICRKIYFPFPHSFLASLLHTGSLNSYTEFIQHWYEYYVGYGKTCRKSGGTKKNFVFTFFLCWILFYFFQTEHFRFHFVHKNSVKIRNSGESKWFLLVRNKKYREKMFVPCFSR